MNTDLHLCLRKETRNLINAAEELVNAINAREMLNAMNARSYAIEKPSREKRVAEHKYGQLFIISLWRFGTLTR